MRSEWRVDDPKNSLEMGTGERGHCHLTNAYWAFKWLFDEKDMDLQLEKLQISLLYGLCNFRKNIYSHRPQFVFNKQGNSITQYFCRYNRNTVNPS